MALFRWDDEYTVNVKSMDDQHRKFFELIDEYYEAIIQRRQKQGMSKVLRGLIDYARTHFNEEEKLMQDHKYPGYQEQKTQHAFFIQKIEDLKERFEKDELVLSVEVTNFMKSWLQNHIQKVDKKYGDFFNARGIR